MIKDRYEPIDMALWQGRIDSTENYDAFRWHQVVQQLDLTRNESTSYKSKFGFALLGFCCDEGIRRNQGRIGAAHGPNAIREELANLPCQFSQQTLLFDAGNIICPDGRLEESQETLALAVAHIRRLGLFPLVIGGGHEVALGHYRGHKKTMVEHHQKPDIGIINFDAHFDLRDVIPEGGSSGTMFKQIANESAAMGLDFNYLCVGIQESGNTRELFKTAKELGVVHILAADVANKGDSYVIKQLVEFMKATENIYITICADVFSAAFAPGVSAPQSLGLNPLEVVRYIEHIIQSGKVIGFDIAEISPRFDSNKATVSLAKVLLFSAVSAICRLKGLDE
ncbi:MAG: formimidoylglutamase [Sporomusaceae bacterium]|nr:formimidoylglutamase [Sporomusaceae bacterium]